MIDPLWLKAPSALPDWRSCGNPLQDDLFQISFQQHQKLPLQLEFRYTRFWSHTSSLFSNQGIRRQPKHYFHHDHIWLGLGFWGPRYPLTYIQHHKTNHHIFIYIQHIRLCKHHMHHHSTHTPHLPLSCVFVFSCFTVGDLYVKSDCQDVLVKDTFTLTFTYVKEDLHLLQQQIAYKKVDFS